MKSIQQIRFNKSKVYAISGLSMNQNIDENVPLSNIEGKKALSDMLRTYAEENKKVWLRSKNNFDVAVPFVKKNDVLVNGFKYYDRTTQKEETSEFYSYYDHLKNCGFNWEYKPLQFVYKVSLSADRKTLSKKWSWNIGWCMQLE